VGPAARTRHTAVWTGTEMLVWGGFGDDFFNTGSRYRPTSNSWVAMSLGPNVPAARELAAAVWTGAELIVWGGFQQGVNLNTGARYNPTIDSWTPTSLGSGVLFAGTANT